MFVLNLKEFRICNLRMISEYPGLFFIIPTRFFLSHFLHTYIHISGL